MDVTRNKQVWDGSYEWKKEGNEWSARWGGPEMQWYGTLLPRLHAFLPAARIVEIATGHGRWTQFLLPQCRQFVGIDLAEKCVNHCRQRFATTDHATFLPTDGTSIPADDGCADLVFSFDSLVHVDLPTMAAYLREIRRILQPQGIAFLHHSNLAGLESRLLTPPDKNQRDRTVSAAAVAQEAAAVGLSCVTQERLTWDRPAPYFIDCVSVFALAQSGWARETVQIETDLVGECGTMRKLSSAYARASFPQER